MNQIHMQQIFDQYILHFADINGPKHEEYYKWQICYKFKPLMDEALAAKTEEFSEALYKVRACSENIIDSYTQPFYGLVKFAEKEPETVRKMFLDLYAADNGDLTIRAGKIRAFFEQSKNLLDKYYPESYLYKQNSHSISAYLFLYDPEQYYMYKYTQSQHMADCIEFYDDWGSGDNINLKIYYRMCDEILEEIKAYEPLLKTNASRFEEKFLDEHGPFHSDKNLHILLFDIIYCAHVYNLFNGISFKRPKSKEKQLLIEQKKKANSMLSDHLEAKENADKLENALFYFSNAVKPGDCVVHKMQGTSEVVSIDKDYIILKMGKSGEVKKLGLSVVIANGNVRYEIPDFPDKLTEYKSILKNASNIKSRLEYTAKALQPYEKYLD